MNNGGQDRGNCLRKSQATVVGLRSVERCGVSIR